MEFVTLILSIILFGYPIYYLLKKYEERSKLVALLNKIPGPPCYPIIGTVGPLLLESRGDRYMAFNNMCKQYGPIVCTWTGFKPEVHLRHPDLIEKVMGSATLIKKSYFYDYLHPWLGLSLLNSTGEKWHSRRKLITPTFHFKILENFMDIFTEKSNILVQKLKKELNSDSFDIYPYVTNCALDIICETAMGTQINAQEESESPEYIKALYEIAELTLERIMFPWLQNDFIFSISKSGRSYKKCLNVLHSFTHKVIQERKILKQNTPNDDQPEEDENLYFGKKRMAFLDLLLNSVEGAKLSNEELREEVDTFMFEGHDTTSSGISWALYVLGLYQDVQDKVYEEIKSIVGDSKRRFTTRDLQEMKYLEQVIKESLRIYPCVGWISRELTEDVVLGGYEVPKGVTCTFQIYQVHHLEELYPHPEEFNPDNFLPENVQGRHPYAFIPFSGGPRNCIGQKFAVMEEKTVLATILLNYKIESLDQRDKVKLISELIIRPENGIRVKITKRS